jgi:hypothetical protein
MGKLLPSMHYPAVMIAAFSLFARLRAVGLPLIVSTYVPVLFVTAVVAWLELRFTNRTEWRPETREVGTDLVFMIVVQLAIPAARWFSVRVLADRSCAGVEPAVCCSLATRPADLAAGRDRDSRR